jgi:nucleotide-binding universal stress UspA family protein
MGFVQRIVVPVDLSELGRPAVERALSLAKRFEASLHFVHAAQLSQLAVSPLFRVAERDAESARDAVSAGLRELVTRAKTEGLAASWELCETDPVSAVRDAVARRRADLVVMATHGYSGFRHFLFGSVAEWMLHGVPCPIWVVKQPDAADPVRRVLWASDFSAHAQCAGELAARIARAFGAELEALHAYDVPPDILPYALPIPPGFEAELRVRAEELLERAAAKITLDHQPITTHLERGSPPAAIARRAAERGAQVIAMGTRGHTGLAHLLLGSVAERTLRLAPCSVLVVPLVGGAETPQGDRP